MAPRYIVSSRDGSLQWPRVPSGDAATVLNLHAQNEASQWLAPEALWERQALQLRALLAHSQETVPYYRERLAARIDLDAALDKAAWTEIPILTRQDLQDNADELESDAPPAGHGRVGTKQSSGSTGAPVRFKTSGVTTLFYYANNLRHYHWHDYDPAGRYAHISRLNATQRELSVSGKPVPWMMGYKTGPCYYFDIARTAAEQQAWLQDIQPQYLTTYPSNLKNLLNHFTELRSELPSLRAVTTMSEALDDETRELSANGAGIPVHDIYSAQEAGIVALQCPAGDGYHIMAESVLVEILDDAGAPCATGETGRVVVTPLHNFMTPLIRYALGDFAEVGAPCGCGRGLPTVRRFLGRVRNMLLLPSGEKIWPSFGSRGLTAIAPIRQHQIVQISKTALEARLVVARELSDGEEKALALHITARLPEPMSVAFVYPEAISRSASGKFEDFVSEIDGA